MELIKIEPDFEKAKSLAKLANLREKKLNTFDLEHESSLVVECYYEICKELITALLFSDGYKTLSHKALIDYLEKYYSEFSEHDVFLLNSLRKKRNSIVYEGVFVESFFIKKNQKEIYDIIIKLNKLLTRKL